MERQAFDNRETKNGLAGTAAVIPKEGCGPQFVIGRPLIDELRGLGTCSAIRFESIRRRQRCEV